MWSGNLLNCQSNLGVRVPDLVTLVQNAVVPVLVGDVLDVGGNGLVGKDENTRGRVDTLNE